MTKQEIEAKLDYFDKLTEELRETHMTWEVKSGKFKEEWARFVKECTGREGEIHHKDLIRSVLKAP